METRYVAIGDESIALAEPSVLKAELILGRVTAIYEQIPDLQDRIEDFSAEYRKRHALPRAMAETRYPECREVSEKAWAESGQVLELPIAPAANEILTAQLPTLLKLAREDVMSLLALISLPDDGLIDAEESGGEGAVEALIAERAKLLRRAKLGELAKLAEATVEIVRELTEGGDSGNLTGLRTIWTTLFGAGQEAQTPSEPSPESDEEPPVEESVRSSSDSPNGSSASGSASDGDGETSLPSPSERPATSASV